MKNKNKMKKLAVLFFVFAMSVTTTFANNDDDKRKEERKELRTQIVKLLGTYDGYAKGSVKAEVTFIYLSFLFLKKNIFFVILK